jgi:hypothetical protein
MEIIGVTLALGGFFFGLYQFYDAQKWKRAEFAASQLQKLDADPVLSAACKILDWKSRTIAVPAPLKVSDDESTFQHEWETLAEGVKPESERKSFDRPMELYRDIFDTFFTYLERVNHSIDIDLISKEQVSSLEYWVKQVASPRFGPPVEFGPFIDFYGYTGVRALMRKFKVPGPPEYSANSPGARALLESVSAERSVLQRPRRRITLDPDE